MLVEADKHIHDALTVKDSTSFGQYMRRYFVSILTDDYPVDIMEELIMVNPSRLGNAEYFKFYALVMTNAANFGFVEATGQKVRHKYHNFEGSYTDPIHLVALDKYLVGKNIEAVEQKQKIERDISMDLRRSLKPQEIEAIWTINGLDHTGKVSVCRPQSLMKTSYSRQFVCRPDVNRLKEINQLNISSQQAGKMSEAEFIVTQLPLIRKIYNRFVNVDKVFFGANERWTQPKNLVA